MTKLLLLILRQAQDQQRLEEEFNNIYDQYTEKIWHYAFRLIGIKEASEDICQDVFAKVWEKRNSVCKVTDLRSYLFKMTKNICINQFRKIVVKKRAVDHFRRIYNEFCFDDAVVTKGYEQAVYEAMKILTVKERDAFVYYDTGYDRNNIAAFMRVSRNTTDNQLASAKKKLRKYVSQKFRYTVKAAA